MGIFSGLGNLLSNKDKVNAPPTPTYYTDPNFSGTQDFLRKYSEDILKGNIPDYYKGIGETMSPDLMKDYVYGLGSDIQSKDLAQQALSGRARTGMSNNAIAQVGNLSASSRFQDYINSIEGKKYLMGMGMGGEQDVRNSAQTDMGDQNTFGQWKYSADLAQEKARSAQANAMTASRWGGLDEISDGIKDNIAFAATYGASSMIPKSQTGRNTSIFNDGASSALTNPFNSSTQHIPANLKYSSNYGSPITASGVNQTATKQSNLQKYLSMFGGG